MSEAIIEFINKKRNQKVNCELELPIPSIKNVTDDMIGGRKFFVDFYKFANIFQTFLP